jgi:hypothetical protein
VISVRLSSVSRFAAKISVTILFQSFRTARLGK